MSIPRDTMVNVSWDIKKINSVYSRYNDGIGALKKQVKDDSAALHQRTKGVIEHLTDEEVRDLLHRKWILPLMENLNSLPDAVLDDFVKQLDAVCKKYETTFEDVESQIASTEHELLGLLDDLQGNEFDMKGIAELKKLLGGE